MCSGGHGPAALKSRYSQLGATMAGGDESVELTLVDALEGVADSEGGKRLPDVVVETKILPGNGIAHDGPIQLQDPPNEETYFSIAIQVFIPFLIAGFGMVGAGLVLDVVQVRFHSTVPLMILKNDFCKGLNLYLIIAFLILALGCV